MNIAPYETAVEPPLSSGQDGRVTRVSRGMLTTVAAVRPASMCTTIAVSDRAPVLLPPPSAWFSSPLRESEPRTRMLTASVGSGAAAEADGEGVALAGRSSPSALLMSTLLMLLLRCQYAQPAAAHPATSAPARVRPTALSTLRRRPVRLPSSSPLTGRNVSPNYYEERLPDGFLRKISDFSC
ncbi:hypothetical protein M2163_005942 [Streptomyces sp. SAI-135]|nr:hypothetical protein [Streptomyces sp. SAI-135]